jgi:hypothetical protein
VNAVLSATVTDDGLPIGSQIALIWRSADGLALQTPNQLSTDVQLQS